MTPFYIVILIKEKEQKPITKKKKEGNGDEGDGANDESKNTNTNIKKAWELIKSQEMQIQIKKMLEKVNKSSAESQDKDEPLEWYEINKQIKGMVLVELLKYGSSFGEYELVYGQRRRTQLVIAREDSHVIKISKQVYQLLPSERKKKEYSSAVEFLDKFDCFQSWGRQWIHLIACFEIIQCVLNQVIYSENDEPDYIYFVFKGDFEISKKIENFEDDNRKALEFANIPLFSYKKPVRHVVKIPGDASQRIRICICGPNTYFGDEEVLNLENRKTSAMCVSLKGTLYRLSFKNLVKIVCVHNNIWSDLQAGLKQKLKWQQTRLIEECQRNLKSSSTSKCARSADNSSFKGSKIKKKNEPELKQITKYNLLKIKNISRNGIQPEYFKKTIDDSYVKSTNKDILRSHQKSQSVNNSRETSPIHNTKIDPKKVPVTPYLYGMSPEFISNLSPVQTSRYFNLKQELLNKRFFSPRTKNLIEIQQSVFLAKRSRIRNHLEKKQLEKFKVQLSSRENFIKEKCNQTNQDETIFISEAPRIDLQQKDDELNANYFVTKDFSPQHSYRKNNSIVRVRPNTIDSFPQHLESNQKKIKCVPADNNEEDNNYGNNNRVKQSPVKCVRLQQEDKEEEFEQFLEGGDKQQERVQMTKIVWKEMQENQEQLSQHEFFEKLLKAISIPHQIGGKSEDVIAYENRIRYENKQKYNKKYSKDSSCSTSLEVSNRLQVNQRYSRDSSIENNELNDGELQDYKINNPFDENGNRFSKFYAVNKDKQKILDKLNFHRLMLPNCGDCVLDLNNVPENELMSQTQQIYDINYQQQTQIESGSQTMREFSNTIREQHSTNKKSANSSRKYSTKEISSKQSKRSESLKSSQKINVRGTPSTIAKSGVGTPSARIGSRSYSIEDQQWISKLKLCGEISLIDENYQTKQEYHTLEKKINVLNNDKVGPKIGGFSMDMEMNIQQKLNKILKVQQKSRIFKKGDTLTIKTGGFLKTKPCPQRFISKV